MTLFEKTSGLNLSEPHDGVRATAESLGADAGIDAETLLFALHTYYAIIVDSLVDGFIQCDGVDLLDEGPLDWFRRERDRDVCELVAEIRATIAQFDVEAPATGDGADLFRELYQRLFPRSLRHELGEYYTPDWLADHLLDLLDYGNDINGHILDPSCGSGTFLLRAIRRMRQRHGGSCDGEELSRTITDGVVGFDLNPLAVLSARANYLMAIRDLVVGCDKIEIPVHLGDSILNEVGDKDGRRFDFVVGNPPWIAWDNLPDDYREATKPLWQRYGLFSLSAKDARHGGGKKDLSSLMLMASADRNLVDGGRLAMVITQTVFQSKGAGDGFRRFRLGPEGQPLRVLRVDDMVEIRPFKDAANWTSTVLIEKGAETEYPVDYVKWLPGDGEFRREECLAEPIEVESPGSPWLVWSKADATSGETLRKMVGRSDYTAHLGANSGGANGVYWLELLERNDDGILVRNLAGKGKRAVEQVECVVEPDLLYPLVRWGDVGRFSARPSAHILMSQDVETRTGVDEALMRSEFPRTHAYLKRFAKTLVARSAYRRYQDDRPFYSMYNVGGYTLSPIKVVWRRMDRRINAAVVEPWDDPLLGLRPVVPQETCVLVDCRSSAEAHYICAVMNSRIVNTLISAHSVHGGKGFGTPGILEYVNLHRFDERNSLHVDLADCSRAAHAAEDEDRGAIQERIDRLAARLWN